MVVAVAAAEGYGCLHSPFEIIGDKGLFGFFAVLLLGSCIVMLKFLTLFQKINSEGLTCGILYTKKREDL